MPEQPKQPPAAAEYLPALLEALLFVADGPVEETSLARVLGLTKRQVEAPLTALGESLRERGVRLQRGPEGVQLVTAPIATAYIEQFLGLESAKRLSTAALETLAVIAYRQPVTRAGIEAIRGVNSDAALDTLRTRGLVDVTGRADGPGRPALFATTQRFLEHFGLERPEDLPTLPEEIAELMTQQAIQLPLEPVALGHTPADTEAGATKLDADRVGAPAPARSTRRPDPLPGLKLMLPDTTARPPAPVPNGLPAVVGLPRLG